MKHFNFLTEEQEKAIFFKKPNCIPNAFKIDQSNEKAQQRQLVAHALGATLYMPGTRKDIAEKIIMSNYSATSYVFCLEDSIGDACLADAEENVIAQLTQIREHISHLSEAERTLLPLFFVRIRTPEHLLAFGKKMGTLAEIIAGFSLPKVDAKNSIAYFTNLIEIAKLYNTWLWALPILESRTVMMQQTRGETLKDLFSIFTQPEFEDRILTIRLGATDLCGLFGLRRTIDLTIYDIAIMKEFMTDVLNYFTIDRRFVVSGCVWEFFSKRPRMMKPLLRETPFKDKFGIAGKRLRKALITEANDGLIREVMLDKVNGINGKTCIHPTHIVPVNSQLVVPKEEYMDAKHIYEQAMTEQVGAFKSSKGNKMNEVKPHLLWAKQVLLRAHIYGVFNEKKEFIDILIAEYLREDNL